MGVSVSCHHWTRGSGARPCSTNRSLPPDLSTRRISCSARPASGMLHNVHVVTTLSMLLSASGMASAR